MQWFSIFDCTMSVSCPNNLRSSFWLNIIIVYLSLNDLFMHSTRMASRCFWDADTDNYAEDLFMNVSSFYSFFGCVRSSPNEPQAWCGNLLTTTLVSLCRRVCSAWRQRLDAIITEKNLGDSETLRPRSRCGGNFPRGPRQSKPGRIKRHRTCNNYGHIFGYRNNVTVTYNKLTT